VIPTRAMSLGRMAAFLAILCIAARPTGARPTGPDVVDRIVAIVDGDPITAHEVRRYGEDRRTQGATEEDLLEAVITDHILAKEIAARKITAKTEDINKYVEEIVTKNNMNDDQFKEALKAQGMTLDQYRARVKDELEKTTLLQQELRGVSVSVTPEEIQSYYDAHKRDFAQRSAVTVYDIFLAFKQGMTRADALRVIEQAKSVKAMVDGGARFEDLARKYSEGPGADRGGLLGTFKKGEMAPPLERIAFALRDGQVSEPVVSPGGVHLIRVEGVEGEVHVPLEQVQDEIRQVLYNQAIDQRFKQWIGKNLREHHHVEILN
jgi:peptidyl-prolyl cis-trans isomerase SurA